MKIVVIALLFVAVLYVFLRARRPAGKSSRKSIGKTKRVSSYREAAPAPPKEYPAVSIQPCNEACDEARALEGKRYLSGDAPLLPLPKCTAENCTCKYSHYEDRRDSNEERRQPFALQTDMYESSGNEERRQRRGRRGGDVQ